VDAVRLTVTLRPGCEFGRNVDRLAIYVVYDIDYSTDLLYFTLDDF
jgi:hypothetical protein